MTKKVLAEYMEVINDYVKKRDCHEKKEHLDLLISYGENTDRFDNMIEHEVRSFVALILNDPFYVWEGN